MHFVAIARKTFPFSFFYFVTCSLHDNVTQCRLSCGINKKTLYIFDRILDTHQLKLVVQNVLSLIGQSALKALLWRCDRSPLKRENSFHVIAFMALYQI